MLAQVGGRRQNRALFRAKKQNDLARIRPPQLQQLQQQQLRLQGPTWNPHPSPPFANIRHFRPARRARAAGGCAGPAPFLRSPARKTQPGRLQLARSVAGGTLRFYTRSRCRLSSTGAPSRAAGDSFAHGWPSLQPGVGAPDPGPRGRVAGARLAPPGPWHPVRPSAAGTEWSLIEPSRARVLRGCGACILRAPCPARGAPRARSSAQPRPVGHDGVGDALPGEAPAAGAPPRPVRLPGGCAPAGPNVAAAASPWGAPGRCARWGRQCAPESERSGLGIPRVPAGPRGVEGLLGTCGGAAFFGGIQEKPGRFFFFWGGVSAPPSSPGVGAEMRKLKEYIIYNMYI